MPTVRVGKSVEKLQKATKLAHTLEQATEELNASLIKFEKLFIDLKLFVPASIQLTARDLHTVKTLWWKKVDATWALFVVTNKSNTREETVVRLMMTSRTTRIEAASNIDALIDRLFDEIVRTADSVETALKTSTAAYEGLHYKTVNDGD